MQGGGCATLPHVGQGTLGKNEHQEKGWNVMEVGNKTHSQTSHNGGVSMFIPFCLGDLN